VRGAQICVTHPRSDFALSRLPSTGPALRGSARPSHRCHSRARARSLLSAPGSDEKEPAGAPALPEERRSGTCVAVATTLLLLSVNASHQEVAMLICASEVRPAIAAGAKKRGPAAGGSYHVASRTSRRLTGTRPCHTGHRQPNADRTGRPNQRRGENVPKNKTDLSGLLTARF
jgi:hypothetical protein